MAKKSPIDYVQRAKIARSAGLYNGPAKKLTRSDKYKLTRLFNVIPSLSGKSNNYKSVAVPKSDLIQWEKRGFKTYAGRVVVNMQGAKRVSYSKKYKAITAYADTPTMYRRNRYTLDGDLEKMLALSKQNDSLISLTQGGDGLLGEVFTLEDALKYVDNLRDKLSDAPQKSYLPAITEVTRVDKRFRSLPKRRNSLPKFVDPDLFGDE